MTDDQNQLTTKKTYIGDGVYAQWDGFGVVISTERESNGLNWISLEPESLKALNDYYALKSGKRKKPYSCPVCGVADENAYLSCNRPNCTDGRDPR